MPALGGGAHDGLAVDREGPGARDHGRAWLDQLAKLRGVVEGDRRDLGRAADIGGERVQLVAASAGEHEVGAGGGELGRDQAPGVAGGAVDRDPPRGASRLVVPLIARQT